MDALYDRRRDLVRLISRMKLNQSELAYQLGLAPTTLKIILRGEQQGVPPEWWGMAEWGRRPADPGGCVSAGIPPGRHQVGTPDSKADLVETGLRLHPLLVEDHTERKQI